MEAVGELSSHLVIMHISTCLVMSASGLQHPNIYLIFLMALFQSKTDSLLPILFSIMMRLRSKITSALVALLGQILILIVILLSTPPTIVLSFLKIFL